MDSRVCRVSIKANPGRYTVWWETDEGQLTEHTVSRGAECSCGGTRNDKCRHIDMVTQYLKDGGDKPELVIKEPEMAKCPVCGSERVGRSGSVWTCGGSHAHYFQHRATPEVKAAMTGGQGSAVSTGLLHGMSAKQYREWLKERDA